MQFRAASVALLLIGLVGCAKAAPSAAPAATAEAAPTAVPMHATATQVKPLEKRKFGGAVTEQVGTALDDLMKSPEKYAAKTVRTEGMVSAVCQHMGCWMELVDDGGKAHIKMAGHAFFVPKEAAGHRAIVQGTVLANDKDHCTEEAAQATGGVAKVEIEASAVEFLD